MDLEKYDIIASPSLLTFEFYSLGPKGRIMKQVVFRPFPGIPNVFNIGFGDVNENGEIDDLVISNNSDSQIVLETVSLIIFKFLEKYPNCYVYATGSTKSRSRLYRIGISNHLSEILKNFIVYGLNKGEWEPFKIGINYEEFLVKLK